MDIVSSKGEAFSKYIPFERQANGIQFGDAVELGKLNFLI